MTDYTRHNLERLKQQFPELIKRLGEDSPSVQDLKDQIAAMEYQAATGHSTAMSMFLSLDRPEIAGEDE